VKPGLTGIWQVERTKAEDFDDMMRMDLRYVDTFSVALDVKLILLTIPAVIRERGRF
jgi:lipopolysaccharide/colanic/teichoic acid biosynthesis glycosyltransferase